MSFPGDDRDGAVDTTGRTAAPLRLADAAAELYGAGGDGVVLDRLLAHAARVTGSDLSAVSIVDAPSGTYTKAAERGISCRLGRSFPLDEGATGAAWAARRPVVLEDYGALAAGHLPGRGPEGHRSAAAVPVWWRDEVVAVTVAFRPPGSRFPAAVVDELEALTQTASAAIVRGTAVGRGLRARLAEAGAAVPVTEAGVPRALEETVLGAATAVVLALGGAPADRADLQVALVYGGTGVRVLAQRAGDAAPHDALGDAVAAAAALAGGRARVEPVPGWGLAVRAELPYAAQGPAPFTPREAEVLALVRDGRTDRQIGAVLGVSPKTVEKHVGAALRKTGAPSRTAAVAVAIDRGWLASA